MPSRSATPGPKSLDHDVAALGEPPRDRLSFGRFQIDRDASAARIDGGKNTPTPSTYGGIDRSTSPVPASSTFVTCAPISWSRCVQYGPGTSREKSRTRTSESGRNDTLQEVPGAQHRAVNGRELGERSGAVRNGGELVHVLLRCRDVDAVRDGDTALSRWVKNPRERGTTAQ